VKIDPNPQGSLAWKNARRAMPTASNFDSIIQPIKMGPSGGQLTYMGRLLAEYLMGSLTDETWFVYDESRATFMERGKELEPLAAKWLTMETGLVCDPVGFCTTDDGLIGCSPDRLIGDDGGAEFKIPGIDKHMTYLLSDGRTLVADYRCQIQGCLWITGRRYWKAVSWNPELPSVCVHVERDGEFIVALAKEVYAFANRLAELKKQYEPYRVVPPARDESHIF
jgi:hypothetical protein